MKNTKRLLAMVLSLVFMFTVMMSGAVFADNGSDKSGGKNEKATEEKVKGNDKVKTEETVTTATEEEKDNAAIKVLLDKRKDLKKALADARKNTPLDVDGIASLMAQIAANKAEFKQLVMEQYTAEELAQLDQAAAAIEAADPTADALPLDKVIAKGRSLKFDMPPIYKEGKVMVPVRAFSAAYGADVQWNGETKEITITTLEGKVLVINMSDPDAPAVTVVTKMSDANTPTETVVSMPVAIAAKNVNGRVVLPVGFLAEQLGLKAEVDEEGTVEIEDEDEAEDVVSPLPNTTITQ